MFLHNETTNDDDDDDDDDCRGWNSAGERAAASYNIT